MKKKTKYWPGTGIEKIEDNPFNWRKRESQVLKHINQYQIKSRAGSVGAKKYMENKIGTK